MNPCDRDKHIGILVLQQMRIMSYSGQASRIQSAVKVSRADVYATEHCENCHDKTPQLANNTQSESHGRWALATFQAAVAKSKHADLHSEAAGALQHTWQ